MVFELQSINALSIIYFHKMLLVSEHHVWTCCVRHLSCRFPSIHDHSATLTHAIAKCTMERITIFCTYILIQGSIPLCGQRPFVVTGSVSLLSQPSDEVMQLANNAVIQLDLYSMFKIIQVFRYKIQCTDNYSAQCSLETVMVILVCLSLHDHKRAKSIVQCRYISTPLKPGWLSLATYR